MQHLLLACNQCAGPAKHLLRAYAHTLAEDAHLPCACTFQDELKRRDMKDIPHPLVTDTVERLRGTPGLPQRTIFIHMNHTNPIWQPDSKQRIGVESLGFRVGVQGYKWQI